MMVHIRRDLTASQQAALDAVEAAATTLRDASRQRDEAIIAAAAARVSRRDIAHAAGLSPGRVQQIVGGNPAAAPSEGRPMKLHEAMTEVLTKHAGPDGWMPVDEVVRLIAEGDLFRRPSDGEHPPAAQIRARARAGKYAAMFEGTTDGSSRVRLRHRG